MKNKKSFYSSCFSFTLRKFTKNIVCTHFLGQHVSVECEGTWWNAKVEDIDGSLVRVVFSVNGRREAIYRGSTRLLPLFKHTIIVKMSAQFC